MIARPLAPALACLAATLLLAACQHAPEPRSSTPAVPNWTDGWQPVALPGKRATAYKTQLADGRWVLLAQSERSASMLRRAVRIEPDRLGRVSFSWKVDALLSDADVQHSDTEDAVVRVLLAFDGDPSRLSAAHAHDVRSGAQPQRRDTALRHADVRLGHAGRSPARLVVNKRSDRIRKIVVESGPAHLGQWRSYTRNVREDFMRAFGEEPGALIGVAVMTDTDNTQSRAEAWYGEVRLD